MAWLPNPSIEIEGVNYNSETVWGVQITYGKSDPTEAFRPAYATATLLSDANGLDISILDDCFIYLDNTTGPQTVFHGKVSDITLELVADDFAEITLTIMSPLAKLAHRQVGDSGYPASLDGERIAAILAEATDIIWTEAGGTWLTQVGDWEDIENLVATIDAGDYELALYNSGAGNTLDLIGIAELSGLGHLTENTQGQIGYQSAGARMTAASAGFTEFQANDIIISGLSSELTTANLRNETIVSDNGGTTHTGQNITSIQTYGRVTYDVTTWLKNGTFAQLWADRDVALFSWPRAYINGFKTRLSAIDSTQVDSLIGLTMGEPVRIVGLPPVIASDPYSGFVEGWSWTIDRLDAEISIYVSDYALSIVSQEWKNVQTTYKWNTINPALIWKTLEVIY